MASRTIDACGALLGLVACSSNDVKLVARVSVSLGDLAPMFAASERVDESAWAAVNDDDDVTGGIVTVGVEIARYVV